MVEGWPEVVAAAVTLRRDLHRRPELAWTEHGTAAAIRDQLDRSGISWRACAETGTVATLAPDAPGRHIALRADIDAMPVREETGLAWSSEFDGVMHACGHDGHMAALFAAAWWIQANEAALPGPVTLLFQPAEEGGHGARRMIEDRALDDVVRPAAPADGATPRPVEAVFGWHNWPAIPHGQAVCPDGPVMSANGTFEIKVVGQGGHASQPESTRDPVLAAAAITVALQQIVARRLPPNQAAVVAVTSIMAPSGQTVTPDHALLSGSIRVGDTVQRDQVFDLITEIAVDTARSCGVEAVTVTVTRYGATVNHPVAAAEMRDALQATLGPDWHSAGTRVPVMASEDFSYYLERVPGAFALIGADDGHGHHHPCHSARYDFNDGLIPQAARVFARIAGVPVPEDAGGIVDPVTIEDAS
jgi:amidohydrolase